MIYYRRTNIFKYKLEESYSYKLPSSFDNSIIYKNNFLSVYKNILHIKKGYRWDGPSGPTIDTPSFMRGSLIHDALYQLIREGAFNKSMRKPADKILAHICREDGMFLPYSIMVYLGVRIFGGKAADPEGLIEVQKAP